jgi:hypothetical protein
MAVAYCTDDVEVVLLEQTDETFLDDRMIVCDQHSVSTH